MEPTLSKRIKPKINRRFFGVSVTVLLRLTYSSLFPVTHSLSLTKLHKISLHTVETSLFSSIA